MSIKILTKSGEEITAVDDARAYNFDAGNKSGIVKGALNEGKLFLVSSNVIGLDSCELRISGHRIVIDSAESITMANRPSVATRYSMIAEVVVSDASVPSFRLFIQPAKTELIQQNLYKTLNGNGTYQLRIGNFTLGTDGLISDIVRTADVISGATNGVGDIEFNVTTETIAGDLEPEVNVDFNEETKKYDMHFALPLSNGTSVIENGEVVKRFNADLKVDKVEGKGLSTNDFTDADKQNLDGLPNATNLTNENINSWNNKLGSGQLVAEYTLTEDRQSITFNNLDLVADGGVYDIAISGNTDGEVRLNINGANSGYYYAGMLYHGSPTTKEAYGTSGFLISIGGYVSNITLQLAMEIITLNSISSIILSGSYGNFINQGRLFNKTNINSITISATTLSAGTSIKIYKRASNVSARG